MSSLVGGASSHEQRPRARALVAAVVIPIVASVAFYAVFIARSDFHFGGRTYFGLFDDAMISMRYAENLAHGHGLVYNAGGPAVEGYTNFLWTLYMAFVHLLPISAARTSLVVELTGVLLLIGCGLVAASLVRVLLPGSPVAIGLATAGTVFFYPLVFWTLRGMETGLAALLVSLLVLQTLHLQQEFSTKRLLVMAALAAAAALVRDDLILPVGVIVLYAIAYVTREKRRRTAMALLGALGGAVAGHEAFRLAYYGDALPNTYYLKLEGAGLPTRLTRGAYTVASALALTLAAPLALMAAGITRVARRRDPRVLLLAAVILTTFLYDLYIGGDAWEELQFADRFLTTASPLLFVLAAVGLHHVLRSGSSARLKRPAIAVLSVLTISALCAFLPTGKVLYWLSDGAWSNRPSAIVSRLLAPLLAGILLVALLALRRWRKAERMATASAMVLGAGVMLLIVLPNMRAYDGWRSSSAQDLPGEVYSSQMGLALATVTKAGDSIALAAAGGLPYFSQRTGVDLLGVNDPHIAREPPKTTQFHPGHTKWDYPYSLDKYRPTIVYALYADPGGVGRIALARYGYVAATVDYSPEEEALDHLPRGLAVYVSPAMAKRIEQEDTRRRSGRQAPVSLELVQSPSAG